MNEPASIPAFYWSRKEHPSVVLLDVQYATLWLFPSGRFRYIDCWPGYAWFSAGGTWHEKDGQLHCQGNSRGWSDGFADNHSNRNYTAFYTPSEDEQQLVPDKNYLSPLTKVNQDTVDLVFSHIDERDLPQHWRNFSDLMWKIERHLGIKRAPYKTFLQDLIQADLNTLPIIYSCRCTSERPSRSYPLVAGRGNTRVHVASFIPRLERSQLSPRIWIRCRGFFG